MTKQIGKEIVDDYYLYNTVGMLLYNCELCKEDYTNYPEQESKRKRHICGICEVEIKAENYIPGEDQ